MGSSGSSQRTTGQNHKKPEIGYKLFGTLQLKKHVEEYKKNRENEENEEGNENVVDNALDKLLNTVPFYVNYIYTEKDVKDDQNKILLLVYRSENEYYYSKTKVADHFSIRGLNNKCGLIFSKEQCDGLMPILEGYKCNGQFNASNISLRRDVIEGT